MTRWPGAWPGEWPGGWQGGQQASPFANMAMRAVASSTVTATLEGINGTGTFADAECIAFGVGSLQATLLGATVELPEPESVGGSSRRRRPFTAFRPLPTMQELKDRRRRRQEAEAIALEAL